MDTVRRRAALAVLSVAGLIATYALVYWWAMYTFEGQAISLLTSVQVVVEAITTAGFGGHAPWESTALNVFVIIMNLTGVAVVFIGVPYILIPLLQNLASEPPQSCSKTDHIIIASYDAHDEILQEELDRSDIDYVVVEPDKELANSLYAQGIPVIYNDAQTVDGLRAANVEMARAVVADMDDELNPTVLLSAKQVNPDVKRISVVSETESATYNRMAGADEVVSGKQELGKSLGLRATHSLAEEFVNALDGEFDGVMTEVFVKDGSSVCGKTIREAAEDDLEGNTIIGGWFGRKFVVSPDPDMVIPRNSILWLVGAFENGNHLETRRVNPDEASGNTVVVCGYGNVGQHVAAHIESEGFETVIIDREEMDGVDIVGDVSKPETFAQLDFDDVRAVVLAVNDDPTAIYAALILSESDVNADIVARANSAESVWKLYHAGATRVISLADVAGESLASLLIEDAEFFTPSVDFEFVNQPAPALAGHSLASADIRRQTGCKVAAIERDGELLTDISAETVIRPYDTLIAAVTSNTREEFESYAMEGAHDDPLYPVPGDQWYGSDDS